ncbi:MAG TPA: ATP-binding cassette domain-containing protein [Acidimicrobiales bacterium]|nr:ATP-binding cassette domain-containing protein [Acidimicrobiales bacterium]
MINFDDVSFSYPAAPEPTLRDVALDVAEGELCVVIGRTGSGKSTLLRAVNGLVPHFSGGHLRGRVSVDGRSTRDHRPRDMADLVGFVGQDPAASFVTDVVEDELAYTMENLGVDPAAMRRRVEDTLDLLGLHEVRSRPVRSLSGGQQQRVAIGAVLAASPRVLVLDEPTSALDPAAAEDVLASLARLVHDVGLTVVVAEHRLERVIPFADRVISVPGAGRPLQTGPPSEVMATSPVAPPIVELGRLAGWSPLPLSVRDARRFAGPLRAELTAAAAAAGAGAQAPAGAPRGAPGGPVATAEALTVVYAGRPALRHVDVEFYRGQITAVMGRNGSGKSTLLSRLAGARAPTGGRVRVLGGAPHTMTPAELTRRVGLVPQDAGVLLWASSVAEECATADRDGGLKTGTTASVLDTIAADLDPGRHPRDLSEGQRLGLALAVILAPEPPLVLLDEPTRGLDYTAKRRLGALLGDLAGAGHAVVVATHDVELTAQVADRVVFLADGAVVGDGPARQMVCHSPVFAPQVAKVFAPDPWLTVGEVRDALQGVQGGALGGALPGALGSPQPDGPPGGRA